MKSSILNIAASVLAFVCGIFTALSWNSTGTVKVYAPPVIEQAPPAIQETAPDPFAIPKPSRDMLIGSGSLKIVSEEVRLKSDRLQYDVDLRFPQILGTDDSHIRALNQHIKTRATEQYQSLLNPSNADLAYYREKWPGVFNSLNMDYEISLADDSLLSIYFYGYSYGIGAAHGVQQSYTVNYDLALKKELQLADIFKRDSNYLEFLSQYCLGELSQQGDPRFMSTGNLGPNARNFENWKVMRDGISFNFDACRIFGCAAGEQKVEIPFRSLRGLLSSNSSVTTLADLRIAASTNIY
jgi:Deacetylase PdaC/Protein of unknown function (DUF3298)